jgi:FKBP-type peptidyl-prolyl cis-trans isomerase
MSMDIDCEVIDLSGDGALLKKILKPGDDDHLPAKGAEVRVHYVGKLLDGTVFDSSRDRGEFFKFKLGQSSVIKGWDQGVATMKKGEVAVLTCKPEYAYGAEGSPPKIPPNATLEFEIELFDWEDFTVVTDGVKKLVVKDGTGYAKPSDRSTVRVKYSLKLANGKFVYESEEVESFIVGCDLNVTEGLEEGVKTMKKEEVAIFKVKADMAHGEEGEAKFGVPANMDVEYEVELVDFEKGRERWEMDVKEKVDVAIAEKERGNEFYKIGKLKRAFKKYKAAVEFIQYESNIKEEDVKKRADDLKFGCNSNMAAVKLREKDYVEVIKLSAKALEIHENDVKVLFRRAQAYCATGSPDEAMADIEAALANCTDDKQIRALNQLQDKVKAQMKKIIEKERKVYGGLFNKMKGGLFDEPKKVEREDADPDGDVQMSDDREDEQVAA